MVSGHLGAKALMDNVYLIAIGRCCSIGLVQTLLQLEEDLDVLEKKQKPGKSLVLEADVLKVRKKYSLYSLTKLP